MNNFNDLRAFIIGNKEYISRTESMVKLIDLVEKRFNGKPINIVETGTMRGHLGGLWSGGDGCSSLVFARLAKIVNGHFWTVDLSQQNINQCKIFTRDYEKYITYAAQDSIAFLRDFSHKIDVLYLDSYDTGYEEEMRAACRHQLEECRAVLDKLNEDSIILSDDAPTLDCGKVVYSVPFLRENGFKILWNSVELGQVALSKIE